MSISALFEHAVLVGWLVVRVIEWQQRLCRFARSECVD